MIGADAWQAFGGLAAVIILLGSLALALRRLGVVAGPAAGNDAANTADRLEVVERDMAALRLHVAEDYISRDDWVLMTSRVIGMLEDHTRMLARLDERTRQRTAKEDNR